MKLESLDTLKDEDLRAVIGRAEELLDQHDRERKEKARENARLILEAAGLSFRDLASKAKSGRSGKGPIYHGGHRYQHPTKTELVWAAKGQKPGWLRQLE